MDKKEIEELIKPFLKKEDVIYEKYEYENDLYLFIVNKKNIKEIENKTHNKVGGEGPIKINLKTKEVKRIHYLEIPIGLIEKEYSRPTNEEIFLKIKKSKYIDVEDIYDYLLNECGDVLREEYDIDIYNDNEIGINFKNLKIKNKFNEFFKAINARVLIDEDIKVLVLRKVG